MKNNAQNRWLFAAVIFAAAFALWTVAVCFVDVQPIGPADSTVGFASLNRWVHGLTGVHMELYFLTDWLSIIPLCFAAGFGLTGLLQWIKRRRLVKVDRSILVLGGFYAAAVAAFVLFEMFPVNYRPLLIDGVSEASYPSSTTLLVLCAMPTARLQLARHIKKGRARKLLFLFMNAFTFFMVFARLVSGVHWLTDIVGGALLAFSLTSFYRALYRE